MGLSSIHYMCSVLWCDVQMHILRELDRKAAVLNVGPLYMRWVSLVSTSIHYMWSVLWCDVQMHIFIFDIVIE